MKHLFTKIRLEINLGRGYADDVINLSISSDYSGSNRKSRLYVDSKRFGETVETAWKSIKTKKLLSLRAGFGEIDWYDNMTNMYTTPVATIERGLKKVRIKESEHGSIPKEWSINVNASLSDTTTSTPILEVVKTVLGGYFTPQHEKSFLKELKAFLQKKTKNIHYYFE